MPDDALARLRAIPGCGLRERVWEHNSAISGCRYGCPRCAARLVEGIAGGVGVDREVDRVTELAPVSPARSVGPAPQWGQPKFPWVSDRTVLTTLEAPCGCWVYAAPGLASVGRPCGDPHTFADLVEGERRLRAAMEEGRDYA